jgi:hypothetical protein
MKNFNVITLAATAIILSALFAFKSASDENPKQFDFTSFTVIESIVPNGMGRSRIINALSTRDYKEFTTTKSAEDKSRNKSSREEIRVKNYEETKLLNFFNIAGIRFQNIAANDAVINSKVTSMLNEGWELLNIVAGVESKAGKEDSDGIFITRFYFKRSK